MRLRKYEILNIETTCHLENFRQFLIISTCKSLIPISYFNDPTIFPERPREEGTMYVEAEDKITLNHIRNIQFVKVSNVLGIIYNSRSGNTQLKWRQIKDKIGKVNGSVSGNSLVNLFQARVLDEDFLRNQGLRL